MEYGMIAVYAVSMTKACFATLGILVVLAVEWKRLQSL